MQRPAIHFHSLAVRSDGTVWAWGYNAAGQLGDASTTNATTPVQVSGLPAARAVTAADLASYALLGDGSVAAWGDNTYGELGDATTTSSTTPVPVSGLTGITQIAAGSYHVLALKSDGTVAAWGLNNAGQLGDATTTTRTTPVAVAGLSNVVQVAAGGLPGYAGQSVALKGDGTVWTWGYGKQGQLGLGANASTPTPTQVPGVSGVIQIAANGADTYALTTTGTIWAWGDNAYGQLGTSSAGHTQNTPVQVNLTGAVSIGAGGTAAFAVKTDGSVWGWGDDNTGQLGDGGACGKTCTTPVAASGLTGAVAVTGGYVHTLAVTSTGTLSAWGRNAEGELGDATTTVATTPVTVTGLSNITPVPPVKATYTYDGDGLRATRTTAGATQQFAWDLTGTVPLLLTDGSTSYLYDTTGNPVEQIDATGTVLYYQHDQYGSTRLLTTSSGTIAATYTYTPYGTLTAHTGTADTPLRWNVQYQDPDTGLYYLRARYYDPTTAQFINVDPIVALTGQSYSYAGNDPLNLADPLGLTWWNPTTWSAHTWTAVGIGLGAVALAATGVGLVAEGTAAVVSTAGGIVAAAGATAIDYNPCVNGGDAVACGGLALGVGGLAFASGGAALDVLVAVGVVELADGISTFLALQGAMFGGAGTLIDTTGLLVSYGSNC